MPRLFQRLRALLRDRSANATVVTAFSVLSLIGGAGLATDTIQWTLWKRQLQRMSDSASLAGAFAKARGKSADSTRSTAQTEVNRYTTLNMITLSTTPSIEVGTLNGYDNAVRTTLRTNRALPFSSMFMRVSPTIQATSTAAAVGFGQYCVVSLEDTATTGITIQGSSTVNLGCGMVTNSQGANALSAGGSARLTASPLAAVGNIPASSVFTSGTVLQPYSIPQPDPYASLTVPTLPNCNQSITVSPSNGNNSTRIQNNGNGVSCYKDIKLQGSVTFDPGVYIIDGASGGGLTINSGAVVSGTGVVFIFTTSSTDKTTVANVTINGGAQVNLSAPNINTCSGTACNYAGILMYQDQAAALKTNANKVNGNSASSYSGSFYFAGQELQFSGDSGMQTQCVQIVARQVTFTGNTAISNDNSCFDNKELAAINGLHIRLVD